MLHKNMKTGLSALTIATSIAFAPAANAALSYSQDFESFDGSGGNTDIFNFKIGNIVNGGVGWFPGIYGAPGNYITGYSAIVDEGGAAQGSQQMSVFSDYDPWSPFTMGPGTTIQAFVYDDVGLITADMEGKTYQFDFDARLPSTHAVTEDPASQAEAFIKVLKSSDSTFNELANNTFDSDANLTTAWSGNTILLSVDAGMVGELLQFGFNNTATDWAHSAVIYDNLNFSEMVVPVPAAIWLFGSGLIGLICVARRKKA